MSVGSLATALQFEWKRQTGRSHRAVGQEMWPLAASRAAVDEFQRLDCLLAGDAAISCGSADGAAGLVGAFRGIGQISCFLVAWGDESCTFHGFLKFKKLWKTYQMY